MIRKIHYGWILCIICLGVQFFNTGFATIGAAQFARPLQETLGFSNTQTSMLTMMRALASLVTMPLVYRYYKKLSLRTGILLASFLLSVGYLLFVLSHRPAGFYCGTICMGIAYSFGSMIPLAILIHNWFETWRSTATAIALLGSGVCSIVAPPMVTALADRYGVSGTAMVLMIATFLYAWMAFFLIRDYPAEKGLEPYSAPERKKKEKKASGMRGGKPMTSVELLVFLAVMFFSGCIASPSAVHLSIHFTTAGYTPAIAALSVSLYGIFLTIGKISLGYMSDRVGNYLTNYIFLSIGIISNFLVAFCSGGSAVLPAGAGVMEGFGLAVFTVGVINWTGDLSTEESYAKTLSISQTIFSLGALAMTSIPGILADAFGSYRIAYIMFAVMMIIILAAIQSLYLKRSALARRQAEAAAVQKS